MKAKRILKYILPATPLGLAVISVAMAQQGSTPSSLRNQLEIEHQVSSGTAESSNDPEVEIKVNGTPVQIQPNTPTDFTTDEGKTTVQVSGDGASTASQTTRTTNPDGTVSISVSSSSNNSSTSTRTRFRGSGQQEFSTESSVNVKAKGNTSTSVSN